MSIPPLQGHSVSGRSVYYVPEFLTPDEETYLIRKIVESPHHNWKRLANRRLQLWGGELTPRNLLLPQPLPGFVESYPPLIQRLRDTGIFQYSPHGQPNHIIMNEYLPGQGIMPHEDGPAYHPVVATISLGSHTIFHYYKYKNEEDTSPDHPSATGRVVDQRPVMSVFLEPRSLIISTDEMYTSHLHGIEEIEEDIVISGNGNQPPTIASKGTPIDNWEMLKDEEMKESMRLGGVLKRAPRYSLTCRDVQRVAKGKTLVLR
ncbi:hypothetical protein BDN72DRAFT_887740 [Pluteus cervinus]|uniref:Uncharacterized protein n=1 Tax=Pluteus cervinus TaxID=181527 RepID=A0ACD3B094_9AGAR|nr:hypothetical protein BDN72DRAFT_887740 [Pluteus cervinus]